jgi:hypothetical protein
MTVTEVLHLGLSTLFSKLGQLRRVRVASLGIALWI